MFRDQEQQMAVCNALTLRLRHKGIRWTAEEEGPSDAALAVGMAAEARVYWERVVFALGQDLSSENKQRVEACVVPVQVDDQRNLLLWIPDASERGGIKKDLGLWIDKACRAVGVAGVKFLRRRPFLVDLSSGQMVVALVAWALWNGLGRLSFSGLLKLDDENLLLVGSLLAAVAGGASGIDIWLQLHSGEAGDGHR